MEQKMGNPVGMDGGDAEGEYGLADVSSLLHLN